MKHTFTYIPKFFFSFLFFHFFFPFSFFFFEIHAKAIPLKIIARETTTLSRFFIELLVLLVHFHVNYVDLFVIRLIEVIGTTCLGSGGTSGAQIHRFFVTFRACRRTLQHYRIDGDGRIRRRPTMLAVSTGSVSVRYAVFVKTVQRLLVNGVVDKSDRKMCERNHLLL